MDRTRRELKSNSIFLRLFLVRTTILNNFSATPIIDTDRAAPRHSAPEVPSRWPNATLLFWSVGLGMLAVLWFVFSYGYIEDDAFIHLEFARSVAEGHGFTFNGLVTNGDTAPAWVLVLAALHTIGLDWVECAKLACALGLISTVLAVIYLVRDLVSDEARAQTLALAAVTVTVLNPYFVHWSFSGMESVTAIGVSLWAIRAAFAQSPSWKRLLTAAALLGVGPLLRPELLLLAGTGAPVVLWRCWRLQPHASRATRWSRLALLAGLMALPLIAWCMYAQLTFGSPIPNTNMAKRGGPLAQVAPRLAVVYAAGFPVTLALFPLAAFVRYLRGKPVPLIVWVLAVWPVLCVLFYLADHTLVQTRYCLLSMPCLSVVTLWLIEAEDRPIHLRAATVAMVLVSLVTIVLTVVPHVENKKEGVRLFGQISVFLRDHVPRDAPVAVFAIGEIAFDSRHPLVDVGGITRPEVIPLLGDPKATFQWAKRNSARYFISSTAPEPGAVPVFSTTMPYFGWTFGRARYGTGEPLVIYKLP